MHPTFSDGMIVSVNSIKNAVCSSTVFPEREKFFFALTIRKINYDASAGRIIFIYIALCVIKHFGRQITRPLGIPDPEDNTATGSSST